MVKIRLEPNIPETQKAIYLKIYLQSFSTWPRLQRQIFFWLNPLAWYMSLCDKQKPFLHEKPNKKKIKNCVTWRINFCQFLTIIINQNIMRVMLRCNLNMKISFWYKYSVKELLRHFVESNLPGLQISRWELSP